jgi:hypothetical protein
MIIYLSGCYSGNIDENILAARKIAIELWERGYTVLTPHLNTIHFEKDCKCKYEDYIKGDLELLARCDVLVLMPNWIDSNGAKEEKEYARSLGMPIYYYPELPLGNQLMTSEQEEHLARIICKFTQDVSNKYRTGQAEHGGNLFDKPNLPMLMEEVQDLVVYAYTLKDQIQEAVYLMLDDDESRNILVTGNKDGKIIKDIDKE